MRTLVLSILFAAAAFAGPVAEHVRARQLMAEAEQTSNPIRLLMLASDIKSLLESALRAHPDDVEVRVDLMRFHTMTPRIAGGDVRIAREQVEAIAARDEAIGHFARGYVAYRADKQFGLARHELKEAVRLTKDPAARARALRWLGWLSQESQQWDDAFATFAELGDVNEIARTRRFCRCSGERP